MRAGLDIPSLIALVVAAAAGFQQFRMTRENRRKVLAEGARDAAQGSDFISQGAERLLNQWREDNARLRERVDSLESNEEHMEAELRGCHERIDALEGLLRTHDIPVPPAGR